MVTAPSVEKNKGLAYSKRVANFLATVEGEYLDISKSAEEIFGYSIAELKKIGRAGIIKNDSDFQKALAQRNQTGIIVAEVRGVRKDGTQFPLLWHSTVFKNPLGQDLVNSVFIDLSDKQFFEQKAKENAFNLELILNNTDEAFLITDVHLNVIKFNHAFENVIKYLYGTEVHDGDYLLSFVSPGRKEFVLTNFQATLAGQTVDFERIYTEVAGEKVFNTTIRPLQNQGKVIGAFLQIKDVTERYKMQENLRVSNERFELAVKASYDIIWDVDIASRSVYFSESIYNNLGYPGPLTISLKDYFDNIIHPNDVADQKAAFSSFYKNKVQNAHLPDHRLKRADGSYMYSKAKMHAVRDEHGNVVRLIGVITDISAQKAYEKELQLLNEKLRKQTEVLTRSNLELERFAYIASHDLQEPLRMVSSFLTLIEKRYANKLDDTGLQFIHFAVDGAARMRMLISDLLDFSRMGVVKDKLETIGTTALVENIIAQFTFSIKEKGAQVKIGDMPDIYGYKSQLAHVFQNLISNALKYSAKAPLIEIGGIEHEDCWEFKIKDNGIGIDPKFYDKIFVVFQKLHTKSEYPGTGIGLAIAKKVVEQHNGRIWVNSEPDKGSTFYFTVAKTLSET